MAIRGSPDRGDGGRRADTRHPGPQGHHDPVPQPPARRVLDRPRPRANEDEAIAALLHDAIEDGRPIAAAKATVSSFGDEVGRIVDGCTDADEDPKPPWFERKQAYMARLATDDRAILLVSASDKLHNARSIVRDLRAHGDKLWSRFNAPRECTLWYYRSLVIAYQQNVSHTPALVEELDRIVSEMEDLAGLHQETDSYRKAIASGEACRTWSTSIAAGQGQE